MDDDDFYNDDDEDEYDRVWRRHHPFLCQSALTYELLPITLQRDTRFVIHGQRIGGRCSTFIVELRAPYEGHAYTVSFCRERWPHTCVLFTYPRMPDGSAEIVTCSSSQRMPDQLMEVARHAVRRHQAVDRRRARWVAAFATPAVPAHVWTRHVLPFI